MALSILTGRCTQAARDSATTALRADGIQVAAGRSRAVCRDSSPLGKHCCTGAGCAVPATRASSLPDVHWLWLGAPPPGACCHLFCYLFRCAAAVIYFVTYFVIYILYLVSPAMHVCPTSIGSAQRPLAPVGSTSCRCARLSILRLSFHPVFISFVVFLVI